MKTLLATTCVLLFSISAIANSDVMSRDDQALFALIVQVQSLKATVWEIENQDASQILLDALKREQGVDVDVKNSCQPNKGELLCKLAITRKARPGYSSEEIETGYSITYSVDSATGSMKVASPILVEIFE